MNHKYEWWDLSEDPIVPIITHYQRCNMPVTPYKIDIEDGLQLCNTCADTARERNCS